ncbi:hypothetical protein ABE096_17255 [Robertmurraya massiliosenegalensis]|uniref:hypothetical protein n=1 Tax=Robertmurraya TaxID=2837507 RepID=UPI0039A40BAC
MTEKQLKNLLFFRKITMVGILLGFLVFLSSFFVSGPSAPYQLSIGISIMVSSMLLFGFGMFLPLMEEVSSEEINEQEKTSSLS